MGATLILMAVCVPLIVSVVLLPLGAYFLIRWLFAPQAVLLDEQNASAALRFSATQVQGYWWLTFGRTAATGIALGAVNIIFLSAVSSAPEAIYALVAAIIGAFTTPFFSIALTLIYFDLKLRHAEATPA
jgi:hypothetical protein